VTQATLDLLTIVIAVLLVAACAIAHRATASPAPLTPAGVTTTATSGPFGTIRDIDAAVREAREFMAAVRTRGILLKIPGEDGK